MYRERLLRNLKKQSIGADAIGDPKLSILLDAAYHRIVMLETQLENLRLQTRTKLVHEKSHTRFFCPMCDDIDITLNALTRTDR